MLSISEVEATKDIPDRSKNAGIVNGKKVPFTKLNPNKLAKLVERFPELKSAKRRFW